MSKIHSCGSLESGNTALLAVKRESADDKADRMAELQKRREVGGFYVAVTIKSLMADM